MAKWNTYLPYLKIHAIHTIDTLEKFLVVHIPASHEYEQMWVEIPKLQQVQCVALRNMHNSSPKDVWVPRFEIEYEGRINGQHRTTKDHLLNRYWSVPIRVEEISKQKALELMPELVGIQITVGQLMSFWEHRLVTEKYLAYDVYRSYGNIPLYLRRLMI